MANELIVTIGGFKIEFHITVITWFVLGVIVTAILCWAGSKIKKADPTKAPTGVVLVFEQLVMLCVSILKANLTKKTWLYLPAFGTMMILMAVSNLAGLLGVQTPTSNLSVVAALVLIAFCTIHGTDIKLHGIIGKLKSWCDPLPILFPLNVIGDLSLLISLSLRLFGNMLGGSVIILLLYMLVKLFFPFTAVMYAVLPFLHMYFDIFTALLQTYIFFTLASYFLGQTCDPEEE